MVVPLQAELLPGGSSPHHRSVRHGAQSNLQQEGVIYLLGPDGDAAYQRSIHHLESSASYAHYTNNRSSSGADVETAGEPEQLLGPVAQMGQQAQIGTR